MGVVTASVSRSNALRGPEPTCGECQQRPPGKQLALVSVALLGLVWLSFKGDTRIQSELPFSSARFTVRKNWHCPFMRVLQLQKPQAINDHLKPNNSEELRRTARDHLGHTLLTHPLGKKKKTNTNPGSTGFPFPNCLPKPDRDKGVQHNLGPRITASSLSPLRGAKQINGESILLFQEKLLLQDQVMGKRLNA